MKCPAIQFFFVLTLVVCLVSTTTVGFAETPVGPELAEDVSAEAMIADLFFLRPVGFAATIVGTAVWILALPFTLPTKGQKKAAEKLVIEPARYTFSRPLGET